jgi:hypothetical protein
MFPGHICEKFDATVNGVAILAMPMKFLTKAALLFGCIF